jgi:hypothetical protein
MQLVTTRAIGDAWYDPGDVAVLRVPSAVPLYEHNVLFSQRRSHFRAVRLVT